MPLLFQVLKQDIHQHGDDVSQLSTVVAELESESSQVIDQLQDTRNRYQTVKNQVDGIVDGLESAYAEQSSYRDMLQVSV